MPHFLTQNAGRILTDAERSHEKANEISSDVSNLEDDLEKTENALNNAEDAVASETAAVEEVSSISTSYEPHFCVFITMATYFRLILPVFNMQCICFM